MLHADITRHMRKITIQIISSVLKSYYLLYPIDLTFSIKFVTYFKRDQIVFNISFSHSLFLLHLCYFMLFILFIYSLEGSRQKFYRRVFEGLFIFSNAYNIVSSLILFNFV